MNDIFRYGDRREEIGRRIKKERKRLKISQIELAAKVSVLLNCGAVEAETVGQSTVSNWEAGKVMPPIDKLACLAEILECDVGYLLCDYDDRKITTKWISEKTGLSAIATNRLRNMQKRVQTEQTGKWQGSLQEQELSAINTLLEHDYTILINIYQYLHSDYNAFCLTAINEKGDETDIFDKEVLLCNNGYSNAGVRVPAANMPTIFLFKIQEELVKLHSLLQQEHLRKGD